MRRATSALVATLVVLSGLEAAARLAPEGWTTGRTAAGTTATTEMLPDRTRLFRFAPGPVFMDTPTTADADGLRVSAEPGPATAPLVFTLGDSSVFGHGVRDGETLHDQLQQELTRAGVAVRVRCGASPGYTTVQSLALLDEVVWDLHPALLVVANLWSDARLDRYRDSEVLARGSVFEYSAFFRMLRWGIRTARGQPTAWQVAWPTPSDAGVRRVPLAEYRANLDAIVRGARSHDVGVLVLGLTHDAWVREGSTKTGNAAPYIEVLESVANAHDAPYVDGTDAFLRYGASEPLFLDKLHPSAAGHAILARAVSDSLFRAGWPRETLIPFGGYTRGRLPEDAYDGTTVAPDESIRRTLDKDSTEPAGTQGLGPAPPAAGAPTTGGGGSGGRR